MTVAQFRAELTQNDALDRALRRFTHASMAMAAQSTVCNRRHRMDERCARWLLMTGDRVGRDEFDLTQEFLSQMLGVRRASVNEVASALQKVGLIEYSRGRIRILDRPALQDVSCECYAVIRNEFARALGNTTPLADPLEGVDTSQNGLTIVTEGA